MPLALTFYIDSAPVTASVLVNVFNKSCGDRKELTLVSNTVHYKGYRFLTRSKIYPKSRRGWRGKREAFIYPTASISRNPWEARKGHSQTSHLCSEQRWTISCCQGMCWWREVTRARRPIVMQMMQSYWRDFPATAHTFSLVWSQHWKGNKTTAWMWSSIGLSQKHQLSQSYGSTKPAFGEFSRPYCSLFKWEQGKKLALESWETRAVLFNYIVFNDL